MAGLVVSLTVGSAGCMDLGTPRWSPDGRQIVYTRFGPQDTEVRLVDLDRSEPPRLISVKAHRPRWSPEGGWIYFLYANDQLVTCRPDGSGVRRMATGVLWYEPSPNGRSIYYVRGEDGAVVELVLATGRAERVTPKGVKCAGAALGPGGELLAYATPKEKGGRGGYEIRLVDLEEGGRERVVDEFVPVAGEKGKDGGLVMFFRPQAAQLVAFQHYGAERVYLARLAGRRSRAIRAARLGWVVMSGISPEGAYLYLTELEQGEVATSRLVDLDTGEVEVLVRDSRVLVGGLGWAPGGGAVAEHSHAGLLVREVQGGWDRYYPVSTDEYAAAARIRMRERRSREALDILQEALSLREADLNRQRLGFLAVDALLLLGERKAAAEALLEAWLLHPVSGAFAMGGEAEAARLFGALRGDDRLVGAIYRALRRKARARTRVLKEAIALSDDPLLLAGLQFRLGEAELAAKNYTEAGKRFRLASEAEGFPAADYAAALAAGAHFVSGRNDAYAEELLLKAIDYFPASPLQDEFRTCLSVVRRNKGALVRRTAEASHESGATAWVTVRSIRSMRWSPSFAEATEGSAAGSLGEGRGRPRFALEVDERSSLSVAGPEAPATDALEGLEGGIRMLRFSPSGDRLACLLAQREGRTEGMLASLPGSLSRLEPLVVDLRGRVILGDPKAAAGGARRPARGLHSVTRFEWSRTGDALVLRGIEKTPDGRSRTQERRIRVPKQ